MDERAQKEKIAPIPRFERKVASKPPLAKEVVITTPVLEKNGDWNEVVGNVERGPANRMQVIKDAHEAKQAFEKKADPEKKVVAPLGDLASKIFTF